MNVLKNCLFVCTSRMVKGIKFVLEGIYRMVRIGMYQDSRAVSRNLWVVRKRSEWCWTFGVLGREKWVWKWLGRTINNGC